MIAVISPAMHEATGSEETTVMVVMMGSRIMITLGMKWWVDTVNWRIYIQQMRVPRSDYL
jgi:hypothetical protein